jgi:hypothetical protein
MIFAENPRAVEGMMKWSERLMAVPYSQWTVGASTALDHWIARQVLRLSEETWQMLLEGGADDSDPSLLSVGRDIIRVRESLFPETSLPFAPSEPVTAQPDEEGDALEGSMTPASDSTEKSIEELLASLGGLTLPTDGENRSTHDGAAVNEGDATELDRKVMKLVDELQEWRKKNAERPYIEWAREERESFNAWMRDYVRAVSSDAALGSVDYDSTREALLSQPPSNTDDSEAFWSQLHDERLAATLLDTMRRDGPPSGASYLHSAFWDLPYEAQLERLLNLGALRPLLDEYTRESDRVRFLRRYGDTLLAGVEMEHLVPDPDGPVRAGDLGPLAASALNISNDERFRLVLLPYRASPSLPARERTRALFALWNQHKAGRARYEEKLFRTGRLGLRYDDDPATSSEEEE